MLRLTRRIGESVVIGDGIEVTIMDIRGNQVHLGITAPREVNVVRDEPLERVRAEKQG